MGVKGLLSFLSAPLIGSLSDVWGRKSFLFITAFFTCIPIPFLLVSIVGRFHVVIVMLPHLLSGGRYRVLCGIGSEWHVFDHFQVSAQIIPTSFYLIVKSNSI